MEIVNATGTNFWEIAIQTEMANTRVDFEEGAQTVEEMRDGKFFPAYQEIIRQMIFDIKMDGKFTRKDRFVAGGHTTDPSASTTYSSVVSRYSMRIEFILTSLNDLDVFAANIGNTYLNSPCRKKIWTKYGPEFGIQQGCVCVGLATGIPSLSIMGWFLLLVHTRTAV